MANLIPGIGVRGLYTLLAPFQAKLLVDTPYNCIAVRRLEDIIAAGGDPQEEYYTANSQSAEKYATDLEAGACIITLQASLGSIVYVPSTFITAMPDQGGIPYSTLILGVSLGAVSDALDLTYIKSKISDVVLENLGVVVEEVKEVVVSAPTNLSQSEHDAVEAARLAAKTSNMTDNAKLIAMTAQRDALLQRVSELEAYIVANPPA